MSGSGSGRLAVGTRSLGRSGFCLSCLHACLLTLGLCLTASAGFAVGETVPVAPAPGGSPAVGLPAVAVGAAKLPVKTAIVNPTWKELKPAQQQALAPLVSEWDQLDPNHKSKWLAIARKFETMKLDEQGRIQERMRGWVALTPDQRRVARESYARTKRLNTDQKSAQWQQYQQLPDEQKKKLAAEASKNKVATLPPSQSKTKTVPSIKSVEKPILQQSIMPRTAAVSPGIGGRVIATPPAGAGAAQPGAAPATPPGAPTPAGTPAPANVEH